MTAQGMDEGRRQAEGTDRKIVKAATIIGQVEMTARAACPSSIGIVTESDERDVAVYETIDDGLRLRFDRA